MSRIQDRHSDTKMQMQQAENQPCLLFNHDPQARESVTFDGTCIAGRAEWLGKAHWKCMVQDTWRWENYEGKYKSGKVHGQGVLSWSNHSKYEGSFQNGFAYGQGVFWTKSGRYQGEMLAGEFHGQGFYVWSNGNRYDGQWKNGKPNGSGTLVWNGKVRPYVSKVTDRVDRRRAEHQTGKRRVVVALRERLGRTLPFVTKNESEGVALAIENVSRTAKFIQTMASTPIWSKASFLACVAWFKASTTTLARNTCTSMQIRLHGSKTTALKATANWRFGLLEMQ